MPPGTSYVRFKFREHIILHTWKMVPVHTHWLVPVRSHGTAGTFSRSLSQTVETIDLKSNNLTATGTTMCTQNEAENCRTPKADCSVYAKGGHTYMIIDDKYNKKSYWYSYDMYPGVYSYFQSNVLMFACNCCFCCFCLFRISSCIRLGCHTIWFLYFFQLQ